MAQAPCSGASRKSHKSVSAALRTFSQGGESISRVVYLVALSHGNSRLRSGFEPCHAGRIFWRSK